MTIRCDLAEAEVADLYGRASTRVIGADGRLQVECGEEPIFIVIP